MSRRLDGLASRAGVHQQGNALCVAALGRQMERRAVELVRRRQSRTAVLGKHSAQRRCVASACGVECSSQFTKATGQ